MKTLLLATLLLTSINTMAYKFSYETTSWPIQATFQGMGIGFEKEVKIEEGETSVLLGRNCMLTFNSVSRKTKIKRNTVLKIRSVEIDEEGGAMIHLDHPRAKYIKIEMDFGSALTWDHLHTGNKGDLRGSHCDNFLYLDIPTYNVSGFSPRSGSKGWIFKDLGKAVKYDEYMTWYYAGNIHYTSETRFSFLGNEIKHGYKEDFDLRYTEMKGPMTLDGWDGRIQISRPIDSYPYSRTEYVEYRNGQIHYDDFLF